MPHPTAIERLGELAPEARNPDWMQLAIDVERRSGGHGATRCSCGRGNKSTAWCAWCWREMSAVIQGWK